MHPHGGGRVSPVDPRTLHAQAEALTRPAVDRAFATYLATARRQVLGTATTTADAAPDELPPSLERWPGTGLWVELLRELVLPAIAAAFDLAFEAAARSDVLQIHRHRQTFMDQVFDRLSQALWTATTFEHIRGDLAEGLDSGESVPRLRDRVADALSLKANSYLAERIARTEAHTAVEGGTHSAMAAYSEASGEVFYQQWIATPDPRTRLSHLAASGQRVRLDEPFVVGGANLAYPGDPTGPAHETVSCRCSALKGLASELDDLPPSPADTYQGSAMTHQATEPAPTTPYADDTTRTHEDTAAAETTSAPAATGETEEPAGPPEHWQGVLAPLDVRGDFRILAAPADGQVLTTDHMWLSWQEQSAGGHDGKQAVGRIDQAWVGDDGNLWGRGRFDLADETGVAPSVARKVADGFAGTVSVDTTDLIDATMEFLYVDRDDAPVDVDDMDIDDLIDGLESGELRELLKISDWRLGGATLVQDPAFATSRDGKAAAYITITDPPETHEGGAVTAAAIGKADLPLAARDRSWDGAAAKSRLAEADALGQGCLWRSNEAESDSTVQSDYKLPFADVIDGTVTAVPAGVFAAAAALEGARGGVDVGDDTEAIRGRLNGYYSKMRREFDDPDITPPWNDGDNSTHSSKGDNPPVAAITAAAGIGADTTTWAEQVAAATPLEPDPAWFTDPRLSGPTKVRVTDTGRVYGHVACWSTDHISFPGQSVRPPRSRTGYAHYHRNRVRCADGTIVFAGSVVMGTGHADLYASPAAAMAHYDDTGYNVADVACGEDAHGIWIAGALKPGVSALQVLTLDRYSLSGDWRNDELVGVCVVNVPGFPISDAEASLSLAASGARMPAPTPLRRMRGQEPVAVIAAGVIPPGRRTPALGGGAAARAVAEWTRRFEAKMDSLADRVAANAYASAVRGAREERELREMARGVNADAVEQARAAIGAGE